jgi:hypothetical protein
MGTKKSLPAQSKLNALAKAINTEQHSAMGCLHKAAEHAAKVGGLLKQAKKLAGHGHFMKWCAEHCDMSQRTVNYYMTCHAQRAKIAKSANMAALPSTIYETVAAARSLPESKAKVERAERREENREWREKNKRLQAKAEAEWEELADVDPDVWVKLRLVQSLRDFAAFTINSINAGQLEVTGKAAEAFREHIQKLDGSVLNAHISHLVDLAPQSSAARSQTCEENGGV